MFSISFFPEQQKNQWVVAITEQQRQRLSTGHGLGWTMNWTDQLVLVLDQLVFFFFFFCITQVSISSVYIGGEQIFQQNQMHKEAGKKLIPCHVGKLFYINYKYNFTAIFSHAYKIQSNRTQERASVINSFCPNLSLYQICNYL